MMVRPHKKEGRFVEVKQRMWLKYHIFAILDHLIILKAKITPEYTHDSPVLRILLKKFRKMKGSIFNADTGYDAEANFKRVSELQMIPNIKQRNAKEAPKGAGSGRKSLPFRREARKTFDERIYHYRGMIEAIFGAEETGGHNLNTRFRIRENQEKWGILSIGWNLKLLNRLQSARSLGIVLNPIIRN